MLESVSVTSRSGSGIYKYNLYLCARVTARVILCFFYLMLEAWCMVVSSDNKYYVCNGVGIDVIR